MSSLNSPSNKQSLRFHPSKAPTFASDVLAAVPALSSSSSSSSSDYSSIHQTETLSSTSSSMEFSDESEDDDDSRSKGSAHKRSIDDVLWELVKRGYELKELSPEELGKAEKKAGAQVRKVLEEWGMKMEAADPRARKERIQEQEAAQANANGDNSSRLLSKSADSLATVYSCKCGQVSFQPKRRLVAHAKKHVNSSLKPSIDWYHRVQEIELQVSKERIRKEQEALEQKQISLRGPSADSSIPSPLPSTAFPRDQRLNGSSIPVRIDGGASTSSVLYHPGHNQPHSNVVNSFTSSHASQNAMSLASPTNNFDSNSSFTVPVGSASSNSASVDVGPILANPELEFLSEAGQRFYQMDVMEMSPKVLIQMQSEIGQMAKRMFEMHQEKQKIKSELDKFRHVFKSQPPHQVQLQHHRQEKAIRDAVDAMSKAQALLNECTGKIERTLPQVLASGAPVAGIKRDSTAVQSLANLTPHQYHTPIPSPGSCASSSVTSPVDGAEPLQKKMKTAVLDVASSVPLRNEELLKADQARVIAQVEAGNKQAQDILAFFQKPTNGSS